MKLHKSLSVLAIASGAALLLALTSCGSPGGTVTSTGGGANTASQEAPATTEAAPASTTPRLGDTFTYSDGMVVTVGVATPFTPSEYITIPEGTTAVSFEVTVVNGTDEPYQPIGFTASILSAGKQATPLYDSANGINTPTVEVPAGKSITWTIAFFVADVSDLSMPVSLDAFDFNRDKVTFTN